MGGLPRKSMSSRATGQSPDVPHSSTPVNLLFQEIISAWKEKTRALTFLIAFFAETRESKIVSQTATCPRHLLEFPPGGSINIVWGAHKSQRAVYCRAKWRRPYPPQLELSWPRRNKIRKDVHLPLTKTIRRSWRTWTVKFIGAPTSTSRPYLNEAQTRQVPLAYAFCRAQGCDLPTPYPTGNAPRNFSPRTIVECWCLSVDCSAIAREGGPWGPCSVTTNRRHGPCARMLSDWPEMIWSNTPPPLHAFLFRIVQAAGGGNGPGIIALASKTTRPKAGGEKLPELKLSHLSRMTDSNPESSATGVALRGKGPFISVPNFFTSERRCWPTIWTLAFVLCSPAG